MTETGDSSPLFAGKISPPRLRSPSVRADQLAKVALAAGTKMLLVRAPAGYGKTTLIAAAVDQLAWQHVWYRLDSLDADPPTFLRLLTQALRGLWPSFGDALLERATESGGASLRDEMVFMLVKELERATGDLFIVLDEYETLASAQSFNDTLTALLDDLPPPVHLILLSRGRPSIPVARMALDGHLIVMTHRDLRFNRDQVAAVVERQSGTTPSSSAVERLLELTEGWPAGVLLAGKTGQGMDPGPADDSLRGRDLEREIFPYLAEQVYARQSRRTQAFLKATCCLESMTALLAETVTGSRDAGSLLEQLEADEIFTFTDPAGNSYRYHPLFRRFVQERLAAEEGQDGFRAVQLRTADGLVRHGLLASAVDLYLTIGQVEPSLAVLRDGGHTVFDECSDVLISRWARALRTDAGASSGWAALLEGHRHLRAGRMKSARQQLDAALSSLGGDGVACYLVQKELADCCFYAGDDSHSVHHLREALALAASDHQRAECFETMAFVLCFAGKWQELDEAVTAFWGCGRGVSARQSAMITALESQSAVLRGDVRKALTTGEEVLSRILTHSPKRDAVGFLNVLANVNYFAGRHERAAHLLQEAQALCDQYQLARRAAELAITRGTLLAQEGHLDQCLAVLDQALASPLLQSDSLVLVEVHARRGKALRRSGSLALAARAYDEALRISGHRGAFYDRLDCRLDLAFTQGLAGEEDDAIRRLLGLVDEAASWRLLFHSAKGSFFLGVLLSRRGGKAAPELVCASRELVHLGHLDFLGQEFVTNPEAARWLLTAEADHDLKREVVAAIALQPGGPPLLATCAALSDHLSLLVLDSARLHLPFSEARRLLEALLRHPSKRIRNQARRVVPSGAADTERLFPGLTRREEEILSILAQGSSNQAIAERLFISVATVKTHVHRILTKTGTPGRLAAAILYRQRSAAAGKPSAPASGRTARRDDVRAPQRD